MESRINFLFAVLTVLVIASVALMSYRCSGPAGPRYFPRRMTLDEAVAAATGERLVFAVFIDGSDPSREFMKGPLASGRVTSWVEANAQPLLVVKSDSGDVESDLVRARYGIATFPTVLLLRKGAEVARLESAATSRELLKWLEDSSARKPEPTPEG